MLRVQSRNTFEKDVKRAKRRGKDLNKLKYVMRLLVEEKPLPAHNRDHALKGNYIHRRECHIEPDWLLIYKKEAGIIILSVQDHILIYLKVKTA